MDLIVYNKNFELITVVDSFKSLMWCKRYNDIGAIDLQVEATAKNLNTFREGYYIARYDDDAVFRIEMVELDTTESKDNSLLIGAYDVKKILNQRIVYETETYDTTVESAIRKMIEKNIINPTDERRKISNFALKDKKNFEDRTRMQTTYANIGEKISSLCKTYDYGYRVTLENGTFYFDLYKGENKTLTSSVVFSPSFDNVVSSKYVKDTSEFKNVALVAGEGEGKNRKKVEIGEDEGLERFEVYVDAKDMSSEEGAISADIYENMLLEKGKEELAQYVVETSFEAEINTFLFKYKQDFDLGDIVSIENEYGIKITAQITEVIETWDDSGYKFEPVFDYIGVETYLTDEDGNTLTTEDGATMLYEGEII